MKTILPFIQFLQAYSKKKLALLFIFSIIGPLLVTGQPSYTFTNASATGSLGPTQTQINSAYLSTNLSGMVTATAGIQYWVVPTSANYGIEALGASGGGVSAGYGARMSGEYFLNAGDTIIILVGQMGIDALDGSTTGGGGSYVMLRNATSTVLTSNGRPVSPLVIGAGGGGNPGTADVNTNASLTTSANAGNGGTGFGAGGVNGNGGFISVSSGNSRGGGGGGYLTDGEHTNTCGTGGLESGRSFLNGGTGGLSTSCSTGYPGGFGGGGGSISSGWRSSGGGGGYSGGGGGQTNSNATTHRGGGGGSYNGGSNPINAVATATGHGRVVITKLCNIVLSASTTNSLAPSICNGQTITLTSNAISNYSWNNGATTASISVSPSVTTSYTLTATSPSNCTTSAVITVTVNQSLPTLTVVNTSSATGGVCPSRTVMLTASGANSYTWTGGSGSVSNGIAFSPASTAVYTVTGTNACGTGSASSSVSVFANPTITAIASSPTVCSGVTTSLIASGTNSFTWSNGLPNGSGFTPMVTNTYIVTGTNSATGCTAQASAAVTVVTTPNLAPVLSSTLICVGQTATITASGASSYSWSTNQTTSSITVSPANTTTYSITKSNANCVDVKTFTLIVNPLPVVFAVANPTIICAFQSTTLNAGGGSSYQWAPFGGNLSQAIVSPGVPTVFTVSASDGTCVNTATVPVAVNPLPIINISTTSSVLCQGESATITVSGADTYSWTAPTGLGTATSIVVTPTAPVLYQVTGTNTLTGCSADNSQIALVNPVPTLTVAATKTIVCVSDPSTVTVKGASNTYTYSWNTGPTTTATIVNPVTTTNYSVTATNTVTSCKSTSFVTVSVFQPTFAVNSPTSSCLGGTITLMATGAKSYTWNGNAPFQSIQVSPTTATFYVVAATSTLGNLSCISSNTVFVSIYANPTITAAPSRTSICKNESVELIASGGSTYTWNTQQQGDTISVTLTGQSNFTVTGTDQNGCRSTATVQVKVGTCQGITEWAGDGAIIIYPNPNSGQFRVSSAIITDLQIVNNLGQVVGSISHSDYNRELKTDLPAGVYFIVDKARMAVRSKLVISR